jgi:chromate transporter
MVDDAEPEPVAAERPALSAVALLFLRLGATAFGGPAVHVAMMETEVVRKRGWISSERFLDMMGAANLIPGPSSSELAVFIGYELAGPLGLLVAGLCFVLPAALLTALIGWAYVRFGALPRAGGILYGIKPVVVAIVVDALLGLAPKAIKKRWFLAGLGVAASVAAALDVDALAVLAGAGALAMVLGPLANREKKADVQGLVFAGPVAATSAATPLAAVSLGPLFLTFLKLGAVVFGSGYVLLAFLRADLVERLHWMTEAELLDAVAVGQVTPGPVFTTATFIGYLLAGPAGAVVATVAIFLPGFVLVAAIRPLVARVRSSRRAGAFLDGVNVAALALMAVVTFQIGRAALIDVTTVLVATVSLLLLLRFKLNSTWLIAAGAIVGVVLQR